MDISERAPLSLAEGWEGILGGGGRLRLERVHLPEFFPKQRWFGSKSEGIQTTRIRDSVMLNSQHSALTLVEVRSNSGRTDTYLLPLAIALDRRGEELERNRPLAVIAPVLSGNTAGLLYDGVFDDQTCARLFSLIEKGEELEMHHGRVRATRGRVFQKILAFADTPLPVRCGSAEQSNTSVLYGDRFILKVFRHQEPGLVKGLHHAKHIEFPRSGTVDDVPPFRDTRCRRERIPRQRPENRRAERLASTWQCYGQRG